MWICSLFPACTQLQQAPIKAGSRVSIKSAANNGVLLQAQVGEHPFVRLARLDNPRPVALRNDPTRRLAPSGTKHADAIAARNRSEGVDAVTNPVRVVEGI